MAVLFRPSLAAAVLTCALVVCGNLPAYGQFGKHDLFVATSGNNAWSGGLPEPSAQRSDGPLGDWQSAATILRQRQREQRLDSPVTVWIRGGTYHVVAPLNLAPDDSGPITYAAFPGEQPVFDAGTRIAGFQAEKQGDTTLWVADVSGLPAGRGEFRSLFVGGQRRPRARLPKNGFYRIADVPGRTAAARLFDGSSAFRAKPGEVRNWKNLGDVEIRVFHLWTDERMPIQSVDEQTGLVTCTRTSIFALKETLGPKWAEYWVENVFEALSEPGEWYLDRRQRKLYYIPMPGETIGQTEVVAAGTFQFLRLHGSPEQSKPITGLTFKGLTFRYADWVQPEQDGKYFDPYTPPPQRRRQDSTYRFVRDTKPEVKYAATPQSSVHAPGVISLVAAQRIAIVDCRIEHVGYWGIDLADGCRENTIEGNTIVDVGAGGIKIDGANYPSDPGNFSGKNRITDNVIRSCGRVFQTAAGIVVTHGFGNLIAHNEISDLYQSGIACGWEWSRNPSVSRDNRIEKNHIFNLGQKLSSDMGGVYVLGVQPGTMVRNNLIHDIQHRGYGGWGIYTDNSTAHVVVENNIVYDVSSQPSYSQGVGAVNREITVRNNIFAFGGQALVLLPENYERKARNIPGYTATYERNIYISKGEPIYNSQAMPSREHPRNDLFLSDLNLFWDVSGQLPIPQRRPNGPRDGLTLAEWHALGSDLHSLVADPKVKDWQKRDFALAPDSPAFTLGFRPIDISDVGPRPEGKRDKTSLRGKVLER